MTREQKIERAIKLTWGSLDSHLKWTDTRSSEGKDFHKRCVTEYAEVIYILSQLYK